jgi:hypothetical protein
MLPRGLTRRVRKKSPIRKFLLVLLTTIIVLSSLEFRLFGANAELVVPITEIDKLQKVGPIHEDFGYPIWYKDSNGLRLELCSDVNDLNCALDPAEIPDPNQPITMKKILENGTKPNFPAELFYQLASSEIDLPNGGRAVATFALEAAWANEVPQHGDQIVFGRVRFRIDGLQTDKEYIIRHPYGVDKFIAVEEDEDEPGVGEVRFVEDIGINGGFKGAMTSRIGTFLVWDPKVEPAAPVGYIGNPNEEHPIINGYNNGKEEQNYFQIEGPGIGIGASPENQCTAADGTTENCIRTNLFSLMGKKATTAGVEVVRATYTQESAEGGTIDVFAWTEDGKDQPQTLEAQAEGIAPVKMFGSDSQYFARIPYKGDTPPKVTVTNVTDKPVTIRTMEPVDNIKVETAVYNATNGTLTVKAASSDKTDPPELKIVEFNEIIPAAFSPKYLPPNITIKSNAGGSITIPVMVEGNATGVATVPVVTVQSEIAVTAGDTVKLDAKNTGGEVTKVLWTQVEGPPVAELRKSNTLNASFEAKEAGNYKFEVTLTGPGGEAKAFIIVTVIEQAQEPPIADAGTDKTVKQGSTVTLDGSSSVRAQSYKWTQVSGTKITLNNANTVKPTFVFPKKLESLVFELEVTAADGQTKTDQVTINSEKDILTVGPSPTYSTRTGRWNIIGTTDVFGPLVTIDIFRTMVEKRLEQQ